MMMSYVKESQKSWKLIGRLFSVVYLLRINFKVDKHVDHIDQSNLREAVMC